VKRCVPVLALLLCGCVESQIPAAPEVFPSQGQFLPFETTETVDALAFGMAPAVDSTEPLRRAMGQGGRTVHVPAGEFLVGPLAIPSNTVLVLAPGAMLRDTGVAGSSERHLQIQAVHNVRIVAHGARLLAERRDYTTGEQRHGVFIFDASNVSIEGLESSAHGGDGFYVGGASQNVTLTGVLADNNRRQGLSITNGTDVYVFDSEFNNTRGTPPEAGIDVEPDGPSDLIRGIVLVRIRTHGNGGAGIAIYLGNYAGGPPADVLIVDHEGPPFYTFGIRPQDSVRYRSSF
jgi:hypothetical protein